MSLNLEAIQPRSQCEVVGLSFAGAAADDLK